MAWDTGGKKGRVTWNVEGKGGMKCTLEGKGKQMGIDLPLHGSGKITCVI